MNKQELLVEKEKSFKKLEDFYLTDNSIKRIDELKQENADVFIRIMITSGGCSGHQYHILMDDYVGDSDFVLLNDKNADDNINNIKQTDIYVVIDEVSLEYLHNSTMDFADGLEYAGFTIDNPNITATCNCGNSFSCSGGFIAKKDDCNN